MQILRANDRELNRWCSIKKVLQYRPDNQEKYDVVAYRKRGQNESMKQRLLPSLYTEGPQKTNQIGNESPSLTGDSNQNNANEATDHTEKSKEAKRRKKSKKNNCLQQKSESNVAAEHESYNPDQDGENEVTIGDDVGHTKRSRKRKMPHESNDAVQNFDSNITDASKQRNKRRKTKKRDVTQGESHLRVGHGKTSNVNGDDGDKNDIRYKKNRKVSKKKPNVKNQSSKNQNNPFTDISDERLKAYGFNPKKFKNKLKYGPTSKNAH